VRIFIGGAIHDVNLCRASTAFSIVAFSLVKSTFGAPGNLMHPTHFWQLQPQLERPIPTFAKQDPSKEQLRGAYFVISATLEANQLKRAIMSTTRSTTNLHIVINTIPMPRESTVITSNNISTGRVNVRNWLDCD